MKLFHGNRAHYREFCALYDEAVKEGSKIPEERAWILWRERYFEGDDGWIPK